MTQGELAEVLGIRFQQVQKYEAGSNRISASRLWDISQALCVPVGFFFDGLDADDGDMAADAEALMQAYRAMPEADRRRLHDLAQDFREEVASAS